MGSRDRYTLLASSTYLAFGSDPLRRRLAIQFGAFFVSVLLAWLQTALFFVGMQASEESASIPTYGPTGLKLIALMLLGGVPAFTIIPACLYCSQPLFGLISREPTATRLFTIRTLLLATAAIATGFAARPGVTNMAYLNADLLIIARDVGIVLSAVMVVLAGKPITGLLLLLAVLPLPFANFPFDEQWSTVAVLNGPVWLSWGLGTWASMCGLLLILRNLGFRLQRQRLGDRARAGQADDEAPRTA